MISSPQLIFKTMKFPCGEQHVVIDSALYGDRYDINFIFSGSDSIIELLLACDAAKRDGFTLDKLFIPYVPFSRQDRVCNKGEPLSVSVFAGLINSLEAKQVIVTDPHSDVTTALINNCGVIDQHEVFEPILRGKKCFWLISPDGGALKKIYKLAEKVKCTGVVECSKRRDVRTGEITGVTCNMGGLGGMDCYIVDDICDGGRTFIEIAKVLQGKDVGKIILCVTHGFFTKGLQVFDGLIDEIYTKDGRIK